MDKVEEEKEKKKIRREADRGEREEMIDKTTQQYFRQTAILAIAEEMMKNL